MTARPLALLALACAAAFARAEEAPTDALLKLLPADAAAALAADDLRGRWADVAGSRLAAEVAKLPAFQDWLRSPNARDFFQARDRILDFLQTSPAEIRDEILGDAAVLAILPPEAPDAPTARARGLLTLKARKPELLKRLIDQVNIVQKQNGEIAAIVEGSRGGVPVFTRRFPDAAGRPSETYVLFPDGTFAFSNSEAAVLEAVDRETGVDRGPSLLDAAGFATTSAGLSGRPLLRAFLAPEFIRRALDEQPEPADPGGRAVLAAVRGRLGDLDRVGAALDVDDAKVQIRLLQAFKPDALNRPDGAAFAPPRPAGERAGRPSPRMMALPETAVAAASFRIDAPAVYRGLLGLVSEPDRPRIAKLETIADALLLGRGLRARILPTLGPRVVAYLDAPDPGAPRLGNFPLPVVASIEINDDDPAGPTAEALQNALGATLAALSLDDERVPATARVTTTADGVTALDAPYPLAFAIDPQGRQLTVGSSADSIARYLRAGAKADAGERFRAIRDAGFPDCHSYAAADLVALGALAERRKDRLAAAVARREGRAPEDVVADVDRLLGAARLFDAAFAAVRFDEAAGASELRVGLLVRPPAAPAPATAAP